ncbi:MAG: hypothetical protein ACR2LI_08180 [Propionibacteriaceae bacterium]
MAYPSLSADRVRSVVVALAAVAQVAVGAFGGAQTGAISDANNSPVTPAGYAFAIWGLIYLASLALAVYQLLPSQIGREVHRRTGWWLVAAFAASTVWVPVFGLQVLWLSQVIILVLLVSLAVAMSRMATRPAAGLSEQALLRLPTATYLGWATLATMAGFGLVLRSWGMPADSVLTTMISLVLIVLATLVCVLVVLRFTALAGFAFTAGWALVAVVVASYVPVIRLAAVVGLLVVVATLIIRTGRSSRKAQLLLG